MAPSFSLTCRVTSSSARTVRCEVPADRPQRRYLGDGGAGTGEPPLGERSVTDYADLPLDAMGLDLEFFARVRRR